MKTLIKNIILILLFGSAVFAETSVDEQIQEIKNAPAHERVKLMNKLKLQLAEMNAEQRNEAISKLRTQTRTQTSIQTRVQSIQADNIQQMQGIDRINQKQVGEHMMKSEQTIGFGDPKSGLK